MGRVNREVLGGGGALYHVYNVKGRGNVPNRDLAAWSMNNHRLDCLFRIQGHITL